MKSRSSRLLTMSGAIAAGATGFVYTAYRKDLEAAWRRIQFGRQVLDVAGGPIEFADSGVGPPVLVIHGAGGGFDQSLDLGRDFLGEGKRIIAPSRFGYLGTPLRADSSAKAQAEAHLQVLDALHLDSVPVIGVSAGGPSAMQLCLEHPERCSALVLVVPMAYAPHRATAGPPRSRLRVAMLNAMAGSDFVFWTMMKVAHSMLLKTILGTPVECYRNASVEERRHVDLILHSILPISKRFVGIANDAAVSSTLSRYPLEKMRVPALVISTADDGYETYEGSLFTAEHIPDAKFVGFSSGGHLLVGHGEEVRSQIASFLDETLEAKKRAAMA